MASNQSGSGSNTTTASNAAALNSGGLSFNSWLGTGGLGLGLSSLEPLVCSILILDNEGNRLAAKYYTSNATVPNKDKEKR